MIDDRAAIYDVLVHFHYLVDTMQPERAINEVFTDDVAFEVIGGAMTIRGRDQLREMVTASLANYQATMHCVTNVRIDVDGDTARSRHYVTSWEWTEAGATAGGGPDRPADVVGVYVLEDTLVRGSQGWKISNRVYRSASGGLIFPLGDPVAAGLRVAAVPIVEVPPL